MPTITILPEQGEDQPTTFSAIMAGRKATGRTVGEALDALTLQLSPEESHSPVIVQQFRPDQHFSAAQRARLSTLMARWQAARETEDALTDAEQSELERLVDEEVEGARARAAHILHGLTARQLRNMDEEIRAELMAMGEQESRRATRIYRASLVAGTIGVLLILSSSIFYLRGSVYGLFWTIIAGAVANVLHILFHRRDEATRKRAESLFLQAGERSYGELRVMAEPLKPPVDQGEAREQIKAR